MSQFYSEAGGRAFEDALEHMREIYRMSVQLERREASQSAEKTDNSKQSELEEKLKRVTRERDEAIDARNNAVAKQNMAKETAAKQEKHINMLEQQLMEMQVKNAKLEHQLNEHKKDAETIAKMRELLNNN